MEINFNLGNFGKDDDTVEVEVFSILDEKGNEVFFKEVGKIVEDGKEFLLCQEVFVDEKLKLIIEEGDVYVFEKILINGEEYLDLVEDYDEAKRIFDKWLEEIGGEEFEREEDY